MSDLCFGFVSSFAFISLRERERERERERGGGGFPLLVFLLCD